MEPEVTDAVRVSQIADLLYDLYYHDRVRKDDLDAVYEASCDLTNIAERLAAAPATPPSAAPARKPNGYWRDKDACAQEAAKYATRTAFQRNAAAAYLSASKRRWLDEFFPADGTMRRPPLELTKEQCAELAKRYPNRSGFKRGNRRAYEAAEAAGWLTDFFGHAREKRTPASHWDDPDNCRAEVKRLLATANGNPMLAEWLRPACWEAIQRHGLVEELLPEYAETRFHKRKRT